MTLIVLLFVIPQSGSSMVTSIFQAHGLDLGLVFNEVNHGYETFENEVIRVEIKKLCQVDKNSSAYMKRFRKGFVFDHVRALFDRCLPVDGWAYKSGIVHYPIIRDAFPDAKVVFVNRNTDSIVESQVAKGSYDRAKARRIIMAQQDVIESLAVQHGYPIVSADEVVAGELRSLDAAFNYCGLTLDPMLAASCIDPGKWRF